MIVYLIISGLVIVVLYWMCMTSPMGYEDENGFHYEKSVDDDSDE